MENNKFYGMYRGKVLSVDDPLKLGRIKAEIYPMLVGTDTALSALNKKVKGIETAIMPWAVPAFSLAEGSAAGVGAVSVPRVGTMLFFFFENGDVYQPVYFASAPDAVHGIPSEISENYPNKKVLKTASGFIITLDDTSGSESCALTHPSGTSVSIDVSGNITFSSVGNVQITANRIDLN